MNHRAAKLPIALCLAGLLGVTVSAHAAGLIDERTPPAPAQPVYQVASTQAPGYAMPYAPAAHPVSGVAQSPAWLAPLVAPSGLQVASPVPLAQAILSTIPIQVGSVQLNGSPDVLSRQVVVPYGRSHQSAIETVAQAAGVALVFENGVVHVIDAASGARPPAHLAQAQPMQPMQHEVASYAQAHPVTSGGFLGSAAPYDPRAQAGAEQGLPIFSVSPKDGNVRRALARWATSAGWTFEPEHWAVKVDIPLTGAASFSSSFEESVQKMLAATEMGDTPVQGCFYPNRVLRVIPYFERCDRSTSR